MDGTAGGFIEALRDLGAFGFRNGWWMGWNLLLAWIPVGLAHALFRRDGSRSARSTSWWAGVVLFALFLPNAPYVVTDLVHLRWQAAWASDTREFVVAVLPAYATLIALGYLAYYLCLRLLDGYLARMGLSAAWRGLSVVGIHAVCAVGVVLGRVARLNSWEVLTQPRTTGEQIVATLTWRQAPVALVATFVAIWVCYTLTRGAVEGVALPWWTRLQRRLGGPAGA